MKTHHPPNTPYVVDPDAIRRSVASSTAIETGENSVQIEDRLKSGKHRFPTLTLAS